MVVENKEFSTTLFTIFIFEPKPGQFYINQTAHDSPYPQIRVVVPFHHLLFLSPNQPFFLTSNSTYSKVSGLISTPNNNLAS